MLDRALIIFTLFAAAFLTSRVINTMIEDELSVPLRLPVVAPAVADPPPVVPISAFLERDLFGTARPAPPEPADCKRTALRARLVATVIGEEGGVAWFDQGTEVLEPIRVGDRIDGSEVLAIGRGAVRVAREGACGEVVLDEVRLPQVHEDESPPKLVERITTDEVRIHRSDLETALADPMRFARDCRIVPKPSARGFALFAIRPGGVADELGFVSGDVIERIDGYQLDEPKGMFGMGELLRRPELTIDYTRAGQRRTLTVQIE